MNMSNLKKTSCYLAVVIVMNVLIFFVFETLYNILILPIYLYMLRVLFVNVKHHTKNVSVN